MCYVRQIIEVGCKTSLKLKEEWSCAICVKFRGRV